MTAYVIDGAASRVAVKARSNIHDTETRWTGVSGRIEADAADLAGAVAAEVVIDMTRHDAGDFLRNRKLRKDLEVERYPAARYRLTGLRDVVERGGGRFAATAVGVIAWHGREVAVVAAGEGMVGADQIAATARFDLDVRELGVEPPRFLMFKVEDTVAVVVSLVARRG
ncbi:MAG TPA: YceI family protein [Kofleriaceae bacterium]|nr:YceI family protein [Kofleriaceae bacterium]